MNAPTSLDESRLRRLIDAGRSVVAERELERVFDRLLDVARELTGARYAAIGVLDDSRQGLADFITAGIDPSAREQIGDLPRGRGVLGMLILDPAPLRLDDVGRHPRSYGFPAGHPPMTSFLGVPILIRGEAWGNLYLTDKQDGPFDNADEEAAVVLAAWAAVAVENARLHREGERRRVRLERSVRALEATAEIDRALGGETRLERILELIAKRTRALVEATSLVILLVDGDELVIATTAGEIPRHIVGERVRAEASVAGRVAASGRPERTTAMSGSMRFALGELGELGAQATAGLFVPMTFRRSTVGVIEAFDRVGGPEFGDDDERILAAAAVSAATAVSTAQTVERDLVKRTLRAAEAERSRWARELHDETLQGLAGLRVLLVAGRRSDDLATLRSTIDDAVEQLATEITSLRSLIIELRPASLDELGLGAALRGLIERMRGLHEVEIVDMLRLAHENGDAETRLDPEIETVVYRVVQEAVANAARHADATRVVVELNESDDGVRLVVGDDGTGFDPQAPSAGFGLDGMRERIALVGGSFDLHSSPAGTTLEALIPARHVPLRTTA